MRGGVMFFIGDGSHQGRRLRAVGLIVVVVTAVLLGARDIKNLASAFDSLVLAPGLDTAVDLRLRYTEVRAWMAGEPVYGTIKTAMYPPATYGMLWPLIGWTSWGAARWIFAISCGLSLIYLVRRVVLEGHDAGWQFKLLVASVLLSNYAIGVAIYTGQISLQVLPPLICSLLIVTRRRSSWGADVAAAGLFIVAMAKPQVALPFGWLLLLAPGRFRPAVLAAVGYLLVTLLSASFQGSHMWAANLNQFKWAAKHGMEEGYGNVNVWLASAGLQRWIMPTWAALFGGLGAWVYLHRRVDVWVLMGVSAIVRASGATTGHTTMCCC